MLLLLLLLLLKQTRVVSIFQVITHLNEINQKKCCALLLCVINRLKTTIKM
jgi:hypothetical protein